jgi:hypothetical protein
MLPPEFRVSRIVYSPQRRRNAGDADIEDRDRVVGYPTAFVIG